MNYSDIKRYITIASYHVNVEWEYVEDHYSHLASSRTFKVEHIPDFQRGHVWSVEQQISYVEFKLKGGYGANVLLWNCPGWMNTFDGPYQLVDGLQRFTAVRDFIKNRIPAFGSYYKDFNGHMPSYCEFIWHVNNLTNRADILRWYIEINEGGIIHTNEEINKVKKLLIEERKKRGI